MTDPTQKSSPGLQFSLRETFLVLAVVAAAFAVVANWGVGVAVLLLGWLFCFAFIILFCRALMAPQGWWILYAGGLLIVRALGLALMLFVCLKMDPYLFQPIGSC